MDGVDRKEEGCQEGHPAGEEEVGQRHKVELGRKFMSYSQSQESGQRAITRLLIGYKKSQQTFKSKDYSLT